MNCPLCDKPMGNNIVLYVPYDVLVCRKCRNKEEARLEKEKKEAEELDL